MALAEKINFKDIIKTLLFIVALWLCATNYINAVNELNNYTSIEVKNEYTNGIVITLSEDNSFNKNDLREYNALIIARLEWLIMFVAVFIIFVQSIPNNLFRRKKNEL